MAVQIKVGPPSYNKGADPAKEPAESQYPFKVNIGESQDVWVSIPQPDKLHVIGNVLPEHFGQKQDISLLGPQIMAAAASGEVGKVVQTFFVGDEFRRVLIELGSPGGTVFFELKNAGKTSSAVHNLELQLNPARLGPEGIFDLLQRLHKAVGYGFKVGAFLADTRVSRLDIAVDVVGLAVTDLIVTAEESGKVAHYFGDDGVLETINIHRKQKTTAAGELSSKGKASPLGEMLLMVYDKRRQQIATGIKPPFGSANFTRVEISKRRFGSKVFKLPAIRDLPNPLKGSKIGFSRSAGPVGSWKWLQYVEARRGGGPERAAFLFGLSNKQANDFEEQYAKHPANVINAKAVWAAWPAGIEATGLSYMIEAAEQKTAGVPPPPES